MYLSMIKKLFQYLIKHDVPIDRIVVFMYYKVKELFESNFNMRQIHEKYFDQIND